MNKGLRHYIQEAGLTHLADKLETLVMPAIRIDIHSLDEGEILPLGVSRFGGLPDLPPAIEWPICGDVPLTFLAQFNMVDLREYDVEGVLPATGLLSIFYEADEQPSGYFPWERGNWRVIYYEGDLAHIHQTSPPSELKITFPIVKHSFSLEDTLPSNEGRHVGEIELNDEEWDAYIELKGSMRGGNHLTPIHQFLGHPEGPETDMPLLCQLASNGVWPYNGDPREAELRDGANDWRLLLQIDTDIKIALPKVWREDNYINLDTRGSWVWHDAGMLYFWIQKDALQQKNFDNVWMQLVGG
ncbi:MAG: DUF1963 domain-containing protein [Chloroflexi bacterium]|nr:DUF1963 domain-containing protein [Chloroflexota bacterium]